MIMSDICQWCVTTSSQIDSIEYELEEAQNKIKELEKIIQELYEDNSYWWQEVEDELVEKVEKAAKQIR